MRTTLTLDDDVADFLRLQTQLHRKSFRQVVNDTLRRGMNPDSESPLPKFEVVPAASGLAPGIDPMRLNRLADELQTENFAFESGESAP